MVIEPGAAWGVPAEWPDDLPVADGDHEVTALIRAGERSIGLAGGDLLTTLGGPRAEDSVAHAFPVDLGWVSLDGGPAQPFAAHVIVRRWAWAGEWAAVMNAAWLGSLYLGPRSHPNDNLLDVTFGRLPWRQRVEARRRARSGTHLPHPDLTVVRQAGWSHEFDRPTPVQIDRAKAGVATRIEAWLEPDGLTLLV